MDTFEMAKFLQETMQFYTPYDYSSEEKRAKKHPNRTKHIRDVAYGQVFKTESLGGEFIPLGLGGYAFDIGNEEAEQDYPYYHILEDTQVIRRKDMGTTRSKGSQASIPARQRDYGKVVVSYKRDSNGKLTKTYSQEYRKGNVRGVRSSVRETAFGLKAKDSNAYVNKHYHWIEKALEEKVLDLFASQFGLKIKRTQIDNEYDVVDEIVFKN